MSMTSAICASAITAAVVAATMVRRRAVPRRSGSSVVAAQSTCLRLTQNENCDDSQNQCNDDVEYFHKVCSDLTTQAQRPGARDATMATATLPPG
jgi:hypothetical protein